jgi:DNA-binding Lrp family transcriptional regulator
VVEDQRLNWTDRAVFGEISSFVECYMSNETMAKLLGVSPDRVRKIIAMLRALGYVDQIGFDGRRRFLQAYSNRPVVNDQADPEDGYEQPPSMVADDQSDRSKTTSIDNSLVVFSASVLR